MKINDKRLEREIENAFRARGLKEQMQQWEREARAKRSLEAREQKITIWPKIRRTVYALSAIAAVVAMLIVVVPTATWYRTYNQVARWGYKQYAHYFLKPQPKQAVVYEYAVAELMAVAEPSVVGIIAAREELQILGHEDLILDASWEIRKGRYAIAESILIDAQDILSEDDAHYQAAMEDIQYLNALCQLGMNKRSKAQKALQEIANSQSRHSAAAAQVAEMCRARSAV